MLLQRLTSIRRLAAILLALSMVAGCAAGGGTKAPARSDAPDNAAGSVDGEAGANVIPPEVQTLYEQAAAAMAGGDFVDAELRFKEFVLQYPDFPGAHVNLAIIHARNKDDAAARAALDAALALNPDHPAALNQMGMLLRRNGRPLI